MKIEDQFRVNVPVQQAWNVLLDLERIAPCMPGAQLQEIEGDEFRGIVKVKVGPITAQYKGVARIIEADEAAGRVVIKAEGRDTRGQGNASATVTATLVADGDGTVVSIDTDLNVTGKVAQFGRGVMADVSSKLLGQFVTSLETNVLSGDVLSGDVLSGDGPSGDTAEPAPPAAATSEAAPATPATPGAPAAPAAAADSPPSGSVTTAEPASRGVRKVDMPEAEAVDLVQAAGGAVAKRLVPTVVVGLIVVAVIVWAARR